MYQNIFGKNMFGVETYPIIMIGLGITIFFNVYVGWSQKYKKN